MGDETPLLRDLAVEAVGVEDGHRNDPVALLAQTQAYNRTYWQDYSKRHKRVFGNLTLEDYSQIKAIADQNHRTVWQQIWAESQAYRSAERVPTPAMATTQQELLMELRRIGNSLNHLAEQQGYRVAPAKGHTQEGTESPLSHQSIMAWCQDLERRIKAAF